MWPAVLILALCSWLIIFSSLQVHAATFEYSGLPDTIPHGGTAEITVSISNPSLKSNPYYLRAVFFVPDTSLYFGYTRNHLGNWHNSSSDHTGFYEISLDQEGSWSGQLQVKPDYDSSNFKNKGTYSFKLGRYTAGGSGPTWSSTVSSVYLQAPDPTPAPTITPKPTSTPKSTPSPTPTSSPNSPAPAALATLAPTPQTTPAPIASYSAILGLSAPSTSSTSATSSSPLDNPKSRPTHFIFIIASGLCFICAASLSKFQHLLTFVIEQTGVNHHS